MKKNDIIQAKAIDYTYDGMAIVKHEGFCLFVRNMIVGEVADIVITRIQKDYGYGKVKKLVVSSPNRVKPQCKLFPQCGGCQLMHMNSIEQAKFKQMIVENNIRKLAKINKTICPLITQDNSEGYRNKMQLPIEFNGQYNYGFYRVHSHDIIPLEYCYLQSELSNELVQSIGTLLTKCQVEPLIKHLLIKTNTRNQAMVVFVASKKTVKNLNVLIDKLDKSHIVSIMLNYNPIDSNVILGNEDINLYGENYLLDDLCGLEFEIATRSFYQVNHQQTEKLYNKVLEYANISKDDTVVDVYCGIGTISLLLARKAKEVIGIEIVDAAIENAKRNAYINNLTNTRFICADAKDGTEKLLKEKVEVDVAVIDPPRKGCDEKTIAALKQMSAQRLVYVSCNPATLARDLVRLSDTYQVEMIQPVDMFPNTYHVESVVLMSRKDK